MRQALTRFGITHIWHFTDSENIQNIIAQGGLLSWVSLNQRGMQVRPGGNDWSHDADEIAGVDTYVHLAFNKEHPMLYRAIEEGRITEPKWLKICASILDDPEVMYTADVSNKAGVELLTNEQAKNTLDLEILFTRTDWRAPEIQHRLRNARKSEILVPNFIPINRILKVI
ncbi:hypothetical protein NFHSH190041_23290 [Shewanella sp. NFH-SH190041]|uniref:DUF4433 domain-containing protein n=1 Tax=Shewanella sp. NFH-SH190041 TaxID=2950245 RepID=UPI0021C46338|nr:DUF4433 domain-containing protein [Shewanella sp. NFH-SH190041]BDM64877.1 hypothetical protein NFHSH190041_23290 [Shewanella sp. NFH-SH190041]